MSRNADVWNYVPPHRGAVLDGGTPSSLRSDNSVDGGWSDRSGQGSSSSGHVYVEEALYDGASYMRRDGEWVPVFAGSDDIDSLPGLIAQVEQINARLSALEETVQNLELSQEGWQEARVKNIEASVADETQARIDGDAAIQRGDVTFDKLNSKTNITAYVG